MVVHGICLLHALHCPSDAQRALVVRSGDVEVTQIEEDFALVEELERASVSSLFTCPPSTSYFVIRPFSAAPWRCCLRCLSISASFLFLARLMLPLPSPHRLNLSPLFVQDNEGQVRAVRLRHRKMLSCAFVSLLFHLLLLWAGPGSLSG